MPGPSDQPIDKVIAQYQAANERRFQNFAFSWQAAALGLAAQAFLFTVALGGSTSDEGRLIACLLSIVASVASLVLMHTQRGYQQIEGEWMDLIEHDQEFPYSMAHSEGRSGRRQALAAARPGTKEDQVEEKKWWNIFDDATKMWKAVWYAFITAAVAVLIITWSHPGFLGQPHQGPTTHHSQPAGYGHGSQLFRFVPGKLVP